MHRSYAVIWSTNDATSSGRLDPFDDRFELYGRDGSLSIRFSELSGASIARGNEDRLRGLPVLALDLQGRAVVRVASLEGAAVLHELADRVEKAGLPVEAGHAV
jgi:hypothetical protein